MQRLLELFCCNWSSPSRDIDHFDGGLLSHSLTLVNPTSADTSKTVPAEEDVIQTVFDMLGQVSDPTVDDMKLLVYNVLNLIGTTNLRMGIITNLLVQLGISNETGGGYVMRLVNTLEEQQRIELATIVRDLPPAVLGDSVAKEQSRVLIDLSVDVRDTVREDKHKASRKRKLLDTLTEMIQQTLTRLPVFEQEQVLLYTFHQQPYVCKLRYILQQLFVSQLVPAGVDDRETLAFQIIGNR